VGVGTVGCGRSDGSSEVDLVRVGNGDGRCRRSLEGKGEVLLLRIESGLVGLVSVARGDGVEEVRLELEEKVEEGARLALPPGVSGPPALLLLPPLLRPDILGVAAMTFELLGKSKSVCKLLLLLTTTALSGFGLGESDLTAALALLSEIVGFDIVGGEIDAAKVDEGGDLVGEHGGWRRRVEIG
jgi:hypothetical protein